MDGAWRMIFLYCGVWYMTCMARRLVRRKVVRDCMSSCMRAMFMSSRGSCSKLPRVEVWGIGIFSIIKGAKGLDII